MTTIIRAADAAQFLTLVPRLAGYLPTRSVVLVPFHGNRTLGAMRIDLPPAGDDPAGYAATLVGMVCKLREADGVAVIVYTDLPLATGDEIVYRELADALEVRLDACGVRLSDSLCVAADGWVSYLDPDGAAARHPLDELEDPELMDRLPDDLREVPGDQSAGAGLPRKDLAQTERTARALRSLAEAVAAVFPVDDGAERKEIGQLDPQALAAACALDDVPALFEDALEWDAARVRPYDAAVLIWCLERPALRDVALMQWCADIEAGDAALEAQLRWDEGEEYPTELASPMWGEGPRPSPERLTRALTLVRHVAALSPRASRPGPLAAAAWIAWALGRGTHAGWYAQAARDIEPAHGLSGIVLAMCANGRLPEWAFERETPVGPAA